MEKITKNSGKILYGVIFTIFIPLVLFLWARYTQAVIDSPAIKSETTGWILMITGILLMLFSMVYLIRYGKGLPMNPYPPIRHVNNGPYRFFSHPIYLGFGMLVSGFFIWSGSSSGLWLVTPLTILCMIALVLGFEKIELKKRFPDTSNKAFLNLPENKSEKARLKEYISALFWITVFLLLANFLTKEFSQNANPIIAKVKIINITIKSPYLPLFSNLFLLVTPFLLRSGNILREWTISGIIALNFSIFIALLYPAVGAQYLPSVGYILITVPIFLILISVKYLFQQSWVLGIIWSFIAIIAVLIQLLDSKSAALHLGSSFVIFLVSSYYKQIWIFLKNLSEKIANSWKEWVFGKVRIINHGFYVASGALLGLFIAGMLAGAGYAWGVLTFGVTALVISALWAQIIEGSEKLKRPFGYYGSLVGTLFSSFVVWLLGFDVWIMVGLFAVVMPWIQAIGRLRCLINGCCHGGRIDNPDIGIRYYHHRSRVCGISGLKGELLHPTPLYSIIWLFFVGFILLALWNNGFPPSFIFGLYLILTGIGRFVEEAYRGEVQTPIIKGLRLYQWTAILSLVIGIGMTMIPAEKISVISIVSWETFLAALSGGIITMLAMGVDFPFSNARFSRLV